MTGPADRPGPPPVFHEKRTYRRRRLIDAARIAPVAVLFLWLLPLIWPQTEGTGLRSATALVYIFTVWALVILCNLVLSRRLGSGPERDEDAPP
ncbi:hypothetical protein [Marivita sp. GX14005]|uniref:hypothetical protein n=1 Tax=Marivita sp. GX14005 TaxID=2942276 RepID=UPI002018A876|nr:hypothetical protein [Marivita sp. GX14005]MCL3880800.1 hypothetical protein [Marivita sp. GX14005]